MEGQQERGGRGPAAGGIFGKLGSAPSMTSQLGARLA